MLHEQRRYRFYANDGGGGSGSGTPPPTGQVPPNATPNTPPVGQVPPTSGGDGDLTAEQLRDALRKARDDGAKTRVDAKELEQLRREKAEREAASLTETQKAAQRAEAAEAGLQRARERIGVAELKIAAQQAGISDPDLVGDSLALRQALTFDEATGEPTNVAKLIADHKAAKPHLYAQAGQPGARPAPASSGGATNPGRQAGNGSLSLEAINAMPPHERIARHKEIKAWQAANSN